MCDTFIARRASSVFSIISRPRPLPRIRSSTTTFSMRQCEPVGVENRTAVALATMRERRRRTNTDVVPPIMELRSAEKSVATSGASCPTSLFRSASSARVGHVGEGAEAAKRQEMLRGGASDSIVVVQDEPRVAVTVCNVVFRHADADEGDVGRGNCGLGLLRIRHSGDDSVGTPRWILRRDHAAESVLVRDDADVELVGRAYPPEYAHHPAAVRCGFQSKVYG